MDDDEYNKSNELKAERVSHVIRNESHIKVNVPIIVDPEEHPKMYNDTDSVSMFNHTTTISEPKSLAPSQSFTPLVVPNPPSILESSTSESKPTYINYTEEAETV